MDFTLNPIDYEKIIQFTADIVCPIENTRTCIQQKLEDYFGYAQTILWHADDQGNLYNPTQHKLSDEAFTNYLMEYQFYDLLHPSKQVELFRQNKALRLADLTIHENYEDTPFYRHFLKKYDLHDEMVVALLHNDSFVGVLGMAQKNHASKYSIRDKKILHLLSDVIASKLLHEKQAETSILSTREIEVAQLVKKGWTNQKIGQHLYISVNTVKKHLQSIYRKFNIQNKIQLVQKL